jgi:hypothetical protein
MFQHRSGEVISNRIFLEIIEQSAPYHDFLVFELPSLQVVSNQIRSENAIAYPEISFLPKL